MNNKITNPLLKQLISEIASKANEGRFGYNLVKEADAKKKAEVEKAKADLKKAEDELEQNAYIKLKSDSGVKYMIGKIIGQSFKTNTIDALASEMAQKLKITTPNDADLFEKDMALYKSIPGMVELIAAIKELAVEEPKSSEEKSPE